MPWNQIATGTSVLGRQTLNCRVQPLSYFSLVLPSVSVSQQKFFGVLSKELLNTPTTGALSQVGIIKVWTKSVVDTNSDPYNDIDLFVFWRHDGVSWQVWRFD